MGLYNFRARFVEPILAGRKQHTIRARRRYPERVGNTMHLYTGLRTKAARLLLRVPCMKIEDIAIVSGCKHAGGCTCDAQVSVDGVELDHGERERLAVLDGFTSFAEMSAFWKGRVPFDGQIVHWKFSAKEEDPNHGHRIPGRKRGRSIRGKRDARGGTEDGASG